MPQDAAETEHVHYDGDEQEEQQEDTAREIQHHSSNGEDEVTVVGNGKASSSEKNDTNMEGGETRTGEEGQTEGCTLYVRNLPTHLTSDQVKSYFSPHGEVVDCRIVINPVTKDSRGFGFVSYRNLEMANQAMAAMDQMELEGRILRIEKARRNKPHDPTPGEYKGPTASIKYDNRGRLKPGYVPYYNLPPPRNGNVRSDRRRDSPSPRRPVARDDRSNRYFNSGGGYYPPRDPRYSSPRGADLERSYRSPRRPSPSWERNRYYPNTYDASRDRPDAGYGSRQQYGGSSYSSGGGTRGGGGGGGGGGYYSVTDSRTTRGPPSRSYAGRTEAQHRSSYGTAPPPSTSYRDAPIPDDRRPVRYERPVQGRRESSGYYNSASADPSSRHMHRPPAGRSRSPPAMRGMY